MEFNKFWELGSYNAQISYIGDVVTEYPVKRHYTNNDNTKKEFSRLYTIGKIAVCRDMFVYSYGISPKRVSNALSKIRSDSLIDKRGKAGGSNKISNHQLQGVVIHIKKIPKYKSHYLRAKTDREFLPVNMTIQVMYDLYKIETPENHVNLSKYRDIFYSNFKIRRKPYQKDTCNMCDKLNIKINNENDEESKSNIILQREVILKVKQIAEKGFMMTTTGPRKGNY